MKVIAETPRLYLRAFILDDSEHFYNMNTDQEVLRYTGDQPFKDREEALQFIKDYKEYEHHGIGRWAVIRKEDEAFLGWCGLKYHPSEGITEVGFRFYQDHWGQGYATEAAEAAIQFGFREKKLVRIHAHAHVENKASIRVIRKLGMGFNRTIDYGGMPANLYSINNPDYEVKEVAAQQVLQVRHPILRAGKPLSDAVFDGDDHPDTFHLGMFYRSELTGVVTLMQRPPLRPTLTETDHQLRGMAVLDGFRRSGIGKELVTRAEGKLRSAGHKGIWMNARAGAVHFYQDLGYRVLGDQFDVPGVGPHFFMEKSLMIKE